jgi:hypothetical protein
MGWVHIDQNDYAAGFEAGYRAVRGTAAPLPPLPPPPSAMPDNMSPFLAGTRKGLKSAGVEVKRSDGA